MAMARSSTSTRRSAGGSDGGSLAAAPFDPEEGRNRGPLHFRREIRNDRRMRTLQAWIAAALVALAPALSTARVVSAGAGGFAVEFQAEIPGSPDAAWGVMVGQVGRWWSGDHTWSGKASNLRIDPRAQGCFCERWPAGQVVHMTVMRVEPGKALVMSGGLGPLLEMGASGALSWQLVPLKDGKGTRLVWRFRVSGYNDKGWDEMSQIVDQVLGEQFGRLQRQLAAG
jgi:uncharacterized protein YndB with AHSA1/START domain